MNYQVICANSMVETISYAHSNLDQNFFDLVLKVAKIFYIEGKLMQY